MNRNNAGQALLEFVLCFPVLVVAVAASILLFGTEWNRIQCAKRTFEIAHRAVRSQDSKIPDAKIRAWLFQVHIQTTDQGVIARAQCGRASEVVSLPLLERARW